MNSDNDELFPVVKRKQSSRSGRPIRMPFKVNGRDSLSCAGCFRVLPVESFADSKKASCGKRSRCRNCEAGK